MASPRRDLRRPHPRPICAGFLVDLWGWRAVFLAGGALVLLLLRRSTSCCSRPGAGRPRLGHWPSTFPRTAAMLALVGGAATLRDGAIATAPCLGLFLLFYPSTGSVAWRSRSSTSSSCAQHRALERAPRAVAALLQCFGTVFRLPVHADRARPLGEHRGPVGAVARSYGRDRAAGRHPHRPHPAGRHRERGVAVVLVAALMATGMGAGSPLVRWAWCSRWAGVGFRLPSPPRPNMTMVMNAVPPNRTTSPSALSATARSLGMVTAC